MDINSLFRRKSIADAISNAENLHGDGGAMVKNLTLRDLTSMGIAAVIGAGIFSTVGKACAEGGPAISVLYVFTAVACLFSALCYAEFASRTRFWVCLHVCVHDFGRNNCLDYWLESRF